MNRQIREAVETTWESGEHWNIDIRWEGKRAVTQKRPVAPWIRNGKLAEEMDGIDGIGTKASVYSLNPSSVASAAKDAFAMVCDDLIEQGFRMYKLQDHIMVENDEEKKGRQVVLNLIRGLADVAKEHGVLITGGETAVLNTHSGFEMGITGTGVRLYPAPSGLTQTSTLLGLISSGPHSNGYTWIRNFYRYRLEQNDAKLIEELTIPTTIYMKEIEELLRKGGSRVHGLVHVTGGGWSKLTELRPNIFDIEVDGVFAENPIFRRIYNEAKLSDDPIPPLTMYERFNCGIGFVVAVDPGFAGEASEILRVHKPVDLHAKITPKSGEGTKIKIIDQNFDPRALLIL